MTREQIAISNGVQIKEVSEICLIPRSTLNGWYNTHPERFKKMCELSGMYKRSKTTNT